MNLQINVCGSPAEVAAQLRKMAEKIETEGEPKGPVRMSPEIGSKIGETEITGPCALVATPRKTMKMPVTKNPEGKPPKKKADPVKKAGMCLKRAIAKAGELVAALREVFPAAAGAAIMVLEDLLADAVNLAQKLARLDSLESAKT